tara:strand:- start:2460 stop:3023 length:564 start_codon:yes stop_codon:yes gene_type:complete
MQTLTKELNNMSFSPISFIATNYRDYKNWWLKAYVAGTTSPLAMSPNGDGTSATIKYQINKDGFFVSAGDALVIPHIAGRYDLFIFPTESEADNNDTSSALRVADGIFISTGDGVNSDDFVNRYGDSMINPLSGPDSAHNSNYMPQLQITETIDARMASAPEFNPNNFQDYGLVTTAVTDTNDYGSL